MFFIFLFLLWEDLKTLSVQMTVASSLSFIFRCFMLLLPELMEPLTFRDYKDSHAWTEMQLTIEIHNAIYIIRQHRQIINDNYAKLNIKMVSNCFFFLLWFCFRKRKIVRLPKMPWTICFPMMKITRVRKYTNDMTQSLACVL